ncbi:MAG: hypothetical protein ACLFPQ_06580 [Candidatus Woesearchaeota archaeon]
MNLTTQDEREIILEDMVNRDLYNHPERSYQEPELKPSVFVKEPDEFYDMDSLKSFAVLGLDIKVTPDNYAKIIEINGINSGTRGFGLTSPPSENTPDDNYCDKALRDYLKGLGNAPLAYVSARLKDAGKPNSRMEGSDIILDKISKDKIPYIQRKFGNNKENYSDLHPEWEERFGNIADNLVGLEDVLEDKSCTDEIFSDQRYLKAKSYEYTENGIKDLIDEYNPQYIVVKPSKGARGEDVTILDLDNIDPEKLDYSPGLIAEPFVPSKPIYSEKDNDFHDGCMRYVVALEETKDGRINIHHFGGYWRLSPKPISETGDIDAMRANLSQDAIAKEASFGELLSLKGIIDQELPYLYKKLVKKGQENLSGPLLDEQEYKTTQVELPVKDYVVDL